MATARGIVSEIEAHVKDRTPTGKRSDWYVGIAADAKKRLFNDHNVSQQNGRWIYREADSSGMARDAESRLHDLGYDGGPGGGDDDTTFVYAYLKTTRTVE